MSLTKAGIAGRIRTKIGITASESLEMVGSFFESIKQLSEEDGIVKLTGFGNFSVKEKKGRNGRNPQTGEILYIKERKVMKFKPSIVLKSAINKNLGINTENESER